MDAPLSRRPDVFRTANGSRSLETAAAVVYDDRVTHLRRAAVTLPLALLSVLCFVLATSPARGQVGGAASADDQLLIHTDPPAVIPGDPKSVELYRLRITNRKEGAIQVSTDAGASWRLIGRVIIPATGAAEGYLAAEYARPGTVAATAVHGHRIRVSAPDPSLHDPLVISIDPREYADQADLPDSYGGHRPGVSGIYTDIPAGTSIFRDLAPITGNPVYIEAESGRLLPLPPGFQPTGRGDVLVIPVLSPKNPLVQVIFQNHGGGDVIGTFADGTSRRLTQVIQPVSGIGRFDGTSYTGVGRLNTAHTGVITVSTAPIDDAIPEGQGRERRGGFQIEPAWHNAQTEEAGAPMVMALGTFGTPRHRDLEGRPPLFRDMVSLGESQGNADTSALVEMSVDDGPWEPLPAATGYVADLFTAAGLTRYWQANGQTRTAAHGVTAFRLTLPHRDPVEAAQTATVIADAFDRQEFASAEAGSMPIVQGTLYVNANPANAAGVSMARLSVEGQVRGFSNVAPFTLNWDTRVVPDGEYLVEAEALNEDGAVLSATRERVYVHNKQRLRPAASAALQ
jgi:hypothetical protein